MATILLSGGHIRSVRGAYSDCTKAMFLAKYMINKKIMLDYNRFNYVFRHILGILIVRVALSVFRWLFCRF